MSKRKRVEGKVVEGESDVEKESDEEKTIESYNRQVIIVMEDASLNVVKSNKGSYELLNCDDHLSLHQKLKKNPVESRPDILHQCLLNILDSPLNKAGHLSKLLVRSKNNVLIEINPETRIPRTFKRFAGLMVQLLNKMKIKSADTNDILMRVVKGPVTRRLPPNGIIFGTSVEGELVDVQDFTKGLRDDRPYIFAFGAIARGNINPEYVDKTLSFSKYPLSGACAISRLLTAFERKWDIL